MGKKLKGLTFILLLLLCLFLTGCEEELAGEEFTLTFDSCGGSAVTAVTQKADTAITAPVPPAKEGHLFVGWYRDEALTQAFIFGTMPASDMTLYAKWQIYAYTLTFDSCGGSAVGALTENYDTALSLPVPIKLGYAFAGWFRDQAYTLAFQKIPAMNLTLYAKWQPLFNYTVSGNNATITGLKAPPSPQLVIPSVIDGYTITHIGENAFQGQTDLTSVTLPATLVGISKGAFGGCTALADLTLPFIGLSAASQTYLGSLFGANNFVENGTTVPASLKTVTVQNGCASVDSYAFYGCTHLENINLPQSIRRIGANGFSGCLRLQSLSVPYGVLTIGNEAFFGCTGLLNITLPGSVTAIGTEAFSGCTRLISLEIPNSVTTLGNGVFKNCSALTSVTLPFVGESAASNGYLGYLFGAGLPNNHSLFVPASLKSVILLDGCMTIADEAFRGCTGLTAVSLPNSVTVIGNYAFFGCTSFNSFTLPGSVTAIGNFAFHGCTGLSSLIIPAGVTDIGNSAFKDCTGLTSMVLPSSVNSLGDSVFRGCSNLLEVTLPQGLTAIRAYSFNGCSSLTTLILPQGITAIGDYAFHDCSSLLSLTLPPHITAIGLGAFSDCRSIETITLPGGVLTLGDYAFEDCTALVNVYLPDSITQMGIQAFDGCNRLRYVELSAETPPALGTSAFSSYPAILVPENNLPAYRAAPQWSPYTAYIQSQDGLYTGGLVIVDHVFIRYIGTEAAVTVPEEVTAIGAYAFYGCKGLTAVVLPSSVQNIGSKAFEGCNALASMTLPFIGGSAATQTFLGYFFGGSNYGNNYLYVPSSLKTVVLSEGCTAIKDFAFKGCTGLTAVTLPNSLTAIGSRAFEGCSNIATLTLPLSVSVIGSEAFQSFTSGQTLQIKAAGQPPTWDIHWKDGSNATLVWGYQ